MTDLAKLIFDPYSRQARLYPALLTLIPLLVTVWTLWPEAIDLATVKGLGGIGVAFGGLYALASYARSCGKRVEKRLLADWGGWPTTIWLRHRSTFLQQPTLARYHQHLHDHVPNWVRPTPQEEQTDPQRTDMQYASAVDWLKEQCRGKNYPLVESELAEYGFRRNLRGLRGTGIVQCLAGIFVAFAVTAYRDAGELNVAVFLDPHHLWELISRSAAGLAILFNAISVTLWLMVVRDNWVRESADHYARALLANCDGVKSIPARRAKKTVTASLP